MRNLEFLTLFYCGALDSKQIMIGGSLNQPITIQNIANELTIHTCMFSPIYVDYGLVKWLASRDLLQFTISGQGHKQESLEYISKNWIPIDDVWRNNSYDLVVIGNNSYLPKILEISASLWYKRECFFLKIRDIIWLEIYGFQISPILVQILWFEPVCKFFCKFSKMTSRYFNNRCC